MPSFLAWSIHFTLLVWGEGGIQIERGRGVNLDAYFPFGRSPPYKIDCFVPWPHCRMRANNVPSDKWKVDVVSSCLSLFCFSFFTAG